MTKRIVLLGLALLLAASMAFARGSSASGGSSGLIKVGIVNLHPSESGYREANVKDMDRVFNAANGYTVLKANDNTLDAQLNAARQYINEGVKYLLISGADANGWTSVLTAAKNAGVKVFLFDRMLNVDPSLYEAAVISDMENQGKNAVAWLKSLNLPTYNILHIQGQIGSAAQIGRTKPLDEAIAANSNWNLVRRGTGGDTWSADEAKKIVEAAIAARENFNIIYAENDGMAEGAMKALQAAGITHGVNGTVKIMGFDCNKFALRYVLNGDWNFDGQCSPFQADVIHGFIQKLEAGQSLGLSGEKKVINEETYFANPGKISQADIDKYGLGD
ncbi:MAG: substrate-binding domain-containing protein [Treponema sp.]|jgi:simple sugar transport system substrate-binding protein|nr:substrate-binding domain-containing protein [Treponema sp.]